MCSACFAGIAAGGENLFRRSIAFAQPLAGSKERQLANPERLHQRARLQRKGA
jgi:hypothetical protein